MLHLAGTLVSEYALLFSNHLVSDLARTSPTHCPMVLAPLREALFSFPVEHKGWSKGGKGKKRLGGCFGDGGFLISLGGCAFVDRNGDPYRVHRLFLG